MHTRVFVLLAAALAGTFSSSAAVTGVVVDAHAKPVGGATVSLFAVEGHLRKVDRMFTATEDRTPLARVTARADGSFSLAPPHPGAYEVHLSAAGFVPESQVVEHDEALGSVVLSAAKLREGFVTHAGKRVGDARITISYGGAEFVTRADREGRFRAPAAGPGTMLFVSHPDHGTHASSVPPDRGSFAVQIPRHAPLRGRVVASDGKKSIAGALVRAGDQLVATSEADGSFVAPHAPLNPKAISAEHPDGLAFRRLAGGDSFELQLQEATKVAGQVTDDQTNEPIAGAIVVVAGRNGRSVVTTDAVTDAKGEFTVAAMEGVNLIVSHPGYGSHTFALDPGTRRTTKNVSLKRLSRVSGVVLDERREPVPGAVVTAESARDSFHAVRWSQNRPARTDGNGRFTLRIPPDHELLLTAAASGTPAARTDPFTLGSGERKDGIEIVIPTGVVVTGRVTDAEGNPVADVAVQARPDRNHRGLRSGFLEHLLEPIRTSADGTFALGMEPGSYDFTFLGEGWAERVALGRQISESATNVIDATLERSVAVRGRVVRNGAGVEGVHVSIQRAGGTSLSASTASDGSFTIDGVAAGRHLVSAMKRLRTQVSVIAPADDVVIELPAAGQISGRVIDRSSGLAIPSFRAGHAINRTGANFSSSSSSTLFPFTDPKGEFTLTDVPLGSVDVVVQADGYANSAVTVIVEEKEPDQKLTVALDPSSRFVGKVTSPDGKPVQGAEINTGAAGLRDPRWVNHRAGTDAAGEFVLDGLTSGDWEFSIVHPRHGRVTKRVTLAGRETRADVRFEPGVSVRGIVVTTNGLPVANASVSLHSRDLTSDLIQTDARGAFTIDGLTPGLYRVSAEKSGYVRAVLEAVEVGATSNPLRLELDTGGTIYGQVTGLTSQDLARARIHAMSRISSTSSGVSPDGSYRLAQVPAGRVRVVATVEDASRAERTSSPQFLEVVAEAEQRHDIVFVGDLAVEGVVRQSGAPLTGALITFSRTDGPGTSVSVRTGQRGEYRAPGLTQGLWTISILDEIRHVQHTTAREIPGPSRIDIDFETARLHGRTLDAATRQPIALTTIELQAFDSQFATRITTDRAGAFRFDSVTTGSYQIRASADGYDGSTATIEVNPGEREKTIEMLLRKKTVGTP